MHHSLTLLLISRRYPASVFFEMNGVAAATVADGEIVVLNVEEVAEEEIEVVVGVKDGCIFFVFTGSFFFIEKSGNIFE